jgi:Fe-S cluster assembly iron-binding protein IscA
MEVRRFAMISITPLAAARLSRLIRQEPDGDQLGMKVVVTTTGCNSYTYGITITEPGANDRCDVIEGIRVLYREEDRALLQGLLIDCDPHTGRFSIAHPNPPQASCPIT